MTGHGIGADTAVGEEWDAVVLAGVVEGRLSVAHG